MNAGKLGPAWDAGRDPQERRGPGRERSRPHLPERPYRTQPGGSLQKFPRGLGQFPLSFLAESRWGPAPPVKLLRSLPGP